MRGILEMRGRKKGQVWVETVIYTLIGLAIIGVVLGISKPRIDAKKDQLIIEQAIEALADVDAKIIAVATSGTGNRRVVDLSIGTGELVIDNDNNVINWEIPSRYEFSEQDVEIGVGSFTVTTTFADPWLVNVSKAYGFNITFEDTDEGIEQLFAAPVAYKLAIENKGQDPSGNIIVDISEIG